MAKDLREKELIICCRDAYDSYDAYHITAAFFPEMVRLGKIRQKTDPGIDAWVIISFQDASGVADEIFRFHQVAAEQQTQSAQIRKQLKYEMGCSLYETLSALTGKRLPWGILTGVRPTKIARRWLEEGMDETSCRDRFEYELKVSAARAALAVEVAKRERELIGTLEHGCHVAEKPMSVYVHIPFCPSRCLYCSFASVPVDKYSSRIDQYLDALEREMASVAPFVSDRPLSCIYVGGGTPTALDSEQLKRLCGMIRSYLPEESCEWTVEAGRPDTITEEKLHILKEAGVDRISINPQTMHDKTLERIGRRHTAAQIREAFMMARAAGFDNINMDLISGLEGEDLSDFTATLKMVGELKPDSVTVHALAVKRASILGQEKDHPLPAEDLMTQMADEARLWAAQQELKPYYLYRQKNMSGNGENIGFAKPGKEGLYNILIMEEVQDILAFGAGAVTKLMSGGNKKEIVRINNVKDVLLYMDQIDDMIKRKEEYLC